MLAIGDEQPAGTNPPSQLQSGRDEPGCQVGGFPSHLRAAGGAPVLPSCTDRRSCH